MTERELDRHGAPIAAADYDRRRGRALVEQSGRVLSLLRYGGLVVRLGSLAPRAAAPVIRDHPAESRQPSERVLPHERRAPRAVNAQDRLALAVLLVVEPDPVDESLCHAASVTPAVGSKSDLMRRGSRQLKGTVPLETSPRTSVSHRRRPPRSTRAGAGRRPSPGWFRTTPSSDCSMARHRGGHTAPPPRGSSRCRQPPSRAAHPS